MGPRALGRREEPLLVLALLFTNCPEQVPAGSERRAQCQTDKMRKVIDTFRSGKEGIWALWLAIAVMAAAVHAVTLRISPTVWQDEVQILDWGRAGSTGAADTWAASWNAAAARPQGNLCYIGCAFQEIGYTVMGGDLAGPRMSALLGAVLASAAMLGWLRARGVDGRVALACSLLFLLDPVFAQGYRGARVDGWTMAFMLMGFWCIRAMPLHNGVARPIWMPRVEHAVAAVCVALAGLCWVSAILLVPLLIHELWCDRRKDVRRDEMGNRLMWMGDLAWVGGFSVMALGILLLPIWPQIRQVGADMAGTTSAAAGSGVPFEIATLMNLAGEFGEVFKYNPWPLLLAGIGCISSKRWPLCLAMAVASLGVLLTSFYIHRAVYLLPYLFLSIALAADGIIQAKDSRRWCLIVGFVLCGMIAWSSGVTLGARTVVALKQRDVRDYRHMRDLAIAAIGPGSHRVYLGSWEPYYAGRRLGWKLFCSFGGGGPGSRDWNALMKTMDFAVFRTDYLTNQEHEVMAALGFSRKRFDCNEGLSPQSSSLAAGYGSYWIYRKP